MRSDQRFIKYRARKLFGRQFFQKVNFLVRAKLLIGRDRIMLNTISIPIVSGMLNYRPSYMYHARFCSAGWRLAQHRRCVSATRYLASLSTSRYRHDATRRLYIFHDKLAQYVSMWGMCRDAAPEKPSQQTRNVHPMLIHC